MRSVWSRVGAGSVTPLELATGYAVFANGGYRISPYFIERIEDRQGNVLATAAPLVAGENAERAIDARNAFTMFNMMQDVIRGGTGVRAMSLGRVDLAGKTGTTNDQMDAWFAGFQRHLVAVAWVGYDIPKSLGEYETGSKAALPMWMSYMGTALRGEREEIPIAPEGVTAVAINPETGLRDPGAPNQMIEYFYHENVPPEPTSGFLFNTEPKKPSEEVNNQLY